MAGLALGSPTRFGNRQVNESLLGFNRFTLANGSLSGKPATVFLAPNLSMEDKKAL